MADMAAPDQLEMCWSDLAQMLGDGAARACPVTYINSAASIKAFCGEHGGVVCTSSNAAATLKWAWERGEKILFLPDQHLGRNTAYKMGVPLDEMVVWDPNEIWGGLEPDAVRARAHHPVEGALLGAHALHRAADRAAPRAASRHPRHRPSRGAVGRRAGGRRLRLDRIHHHDRCSDEPGRLDLGRRHRDPPRQSARAARCAPDRTVLSLDQFGCLCSTMFRVSPNHLLWILEGLVDGEVHNRIVVPDDQKHWTKVALDRMLSIS